jgi:hypothetical protein
MSFPLPVDKDPRRGEATECRTQLTTRASYQQEDPPAMAALRIIFANLVISSPVNWLGLTA